MEEAKQLSLLRPLSGTTSALPSDARARFLAVAQYLTAAGAIASIIYFLPDYFWLESVTAYHSALILSFFGVPAAYNVSQGMALVNEFWVDRACTGVQVIATFAGILLPLPRLSWPRKLLGLALVGVGVYLVNILRIVIQLWVYYAGAWDWTTIHGPGGVALGVIAVTALVLLVDRFVPEFGDFILSLMKR